MQFWILAILSTLKIQIKMRMILQTAMICNKILSNFKDSKRSINKEWKVHRLTNKLNRMQQDLAWKNRLGWRRNNNFRNFSRVERILWFKDLTYTA